MCGIAGLSQRAPVSREALAAAARMLAHRGPDSSGVHVAPSGRDGLAHTRLAIIDLSPLGHQPMVHEPTGVAVTFNGEIYNFRELKADLAGSGFAFRGGSDTEVLLAGYLAWGEGVLERLSGIFAFAIHDPRSDTLLLARDQLGVKPLYYAQTPDGFGFASEIKALLALMPLDRGLDRVAIARTLAFLWSPGSSTPFSAVKKLAPGGAMLVSRSVIKREWIYWTPPAYRPRRDWTAAQCARELDETLARCVVRQMVSDAPLGAFLSGGLDSSAVVAAARAQDREIPCFTISLEGGAEAGTTEDLPYARAAARHLGVPLHEVHVTAQDIGDHVEHMVAMLDEPLADPACLNVFFISRLAREHGMKVLLSGAGGDDLFTGYRRHQALAWSGAIDAVPGVLRRGAAGLFSGLDRTKGLTRRLARFAELAAADGDDRILSSFQWTAAGDVRRLLAPDLREAISEADIVAPLRAVLDAHSGEPAVEKSLALDRQFFLADHNLIYTDKMAMAAGVEVRVPLLDLELVEFAAGIPAEWKLRGTTAKWIFKESQRTALPAGIIDRPKTGFGAPLRRWIGGGLNGLVNDLLSRDTLKRRGLFDPDAVSSLIERNASGRIDGSYTIFALMCVELWCRTFADGSHSAVAAPRAAAPALSG